MADTPSISVVMPVYNGEQFLSQAIESILGQTYTDFEFIIVDDASTDRTAELLTRYAADPRVQLHRLPRNSGVTAALNHGIRHARGRFIARMDADDISLPDRLDKQLRYMERDPDVAVVGSWVHRMDESGQLQRLHRYPVDPALVAWSMVFFNSLAHPTTLIRADVLDREQAYSSRYPGNEDYDLFMRLSLTERLANLPETLLHYRCWSGNVSRDAAQLEVSRRVIRDTVADLGVTMTEQQAGGLLGLSRDRYPTDPREAWDLAQLVAALCAAYVNRVARTRAERAAIATDAAMRLWQLTAISLRHSPVLAARIARSALRTRALAVFPFARKVVSHLVGSSLAQSWTATR